jgi:hypothetical protein
LRFDTIGGRSKQFVVVFKKGFVDLAEDGETF